MVGECTGLNILFMVMCTLCLFMYVSALVCVDTFRLSEGWRGREGGEAGGRGGGREEGGGGDGMGEPDIRPIYVKD